MSHLPEKEVALNVFNYRDTGLGYADLGAVIMALGLAYDSDEARAFAAWLFKR
jgi:ribonucleoside-diphosphate reductase alpha chain